MQSVVEEDACVSDVWSSLFPSRFVLVVDKKKRHDVRNFPKFIDASYTMQTPFSFGCRYSLFSHG